MAKSAYIAAYTPNLVPQSGDEKVAQLERFLDEELALISLSIRGASVQAAYGALVLRTPHTNTLDIVPKLLTGFDGTSPPVPNRVVFDLPLGKLTVEESGVYLLNGFFSADVDLFESYTITIYVDGIPSDVTVGIETSNQVAVITLNFVAYISLKQGERVEAWGSAGTDGATFNALSAFMGVNRISELHDVQRTGI
jgi:hypothetical protein